MSMAVSFPWMLFFFSYYYCLSFLCFLLYFCTFLFMNSSIFLIFYSSVRLWWFGHLSGQLYFPLLSISRSRFFRASLKIYSLFYSNSALNLARLVLRPYLLLILLHAFLQQFYFAFSLSTSPLHSHLYFEWFHLKGCSWPSLFSFLVVTMEAVYFNNSRFLLILSSSSILRILNIDRGTFSFAPASSSHLSISLFCAE